MYLKVSNRNVFEFRGKPFAVYSYVFYMYILCRYAIYSNIKFEDIQVIKGLINLDF